MQLKVLWLYAFLMPQLVRSLVVIDSTLATACIYYDKTFDWGCNSTGNGMKAYKCRCENVNWLGTVTNCILSGSNSSRLVNHALRHVAARCKARGGFNYTLEDMYRFYRNGTAYLRDPTPFDLKHPVNTTLKIEQEKFDYYHRKFKDYTLFVRNSQWFGWGLVFFWCVIIGLATFFNVCDRLLGWRVLRSNWVKKHIMIPSLYKDYHQRIFYFGNFIPFSFPTRLESLVILAFLVLTVVSCAVGYDLQLPHPYLTTNWYRNLNLLSYRVDLLAISLFPVIYFFGIRNNPFIPLSGLSYATFNLYHKWCAYVCCTLAFIHSIIWTIYSRSKEGGGYAMWWVDDYWKWGVFATVLIVLLVVHSEKAFRDRAYEFFLLCHKLFNVLFVVCMYYHIKDLGWLGWIWSMIAILCFDRLARIVRIILCGGLQTAMISNVGENVVKIRFKKPKFFAYTPGSFVYLYFVKGKDPWVIPFQSHPFTVLSTPDAEGNEVQVYFKVQKGVTRLLLNKLLMSEKDSLEYKVLVEGPYGMDLPRFRPLKSRLVGVTAGLGVAAVYPYFARAFETESEYQNAFYWIINDLDYLNWFSKELSYLEKSGCKITIIFTKRKDLDETSSYSSSSSELLKEGKSSYKIIELHQRPDLFELVKEQIQISSELNQDVRFISCGSSMFNDQFRHSVEAGISKDLDIDVDLQEESYTW